MGVRVVGSGGSRARAAWNCVVWNKRTRQYYKSRVTRHTSPGIYLFPVVGQGALVQAVAAAVAVEAKSDLRDV